MLVLAGKYKIKNMKNKILIALFLLFNIVGNAQLTTNLVLNSRPPANLSEWSLIKGTITYIISNLQSPKKAKIKVAIKATDGTEVSSTDLNKASTIIIRDGNTILNAATVFPLEIQKFAGKYQNSLNRTGKLPADSYQFCVELVDEASFAPLAPAQCRSFFVAGLQLPILMMPANEQELDIKKAQTAIMFRWTPLVPKPASAVNYRLQVFEILTNQQPVQALRSNQPILDKIITGQSQYIWQPQGILGSENEEKQDSSLHQKGWDGIIKGGTGKRFIWNIQTLDALQNPIGVDANYEGRSEPIIFYIKFGHKP
jgi:hypothetical protein